MTNSYQSTAFQGSARPVDTFVAPPQYQPISDIENLSRILSEINPNLQKFFSTKLEDAANKEKDLAAFNAQQAYNEQKNNKVFQNEYKNKIKSIRQTLGNDVANSVTTNSIIYKNAYEDAWSKLVGSGLSINLDNAYNTEQINEKPIYTYPWESVEVQTWLQNTLAKDASLLESIDSKNFQDNFLPQQDKAIKSFYKTFQKDRSAYRIDNHVSNAAPIIVDAFHNFENSKFSLPISEIEFVDEEKLLVSDVLIQSYEQNTNTLGLSSDEMTRVNKAREDAVVDLARRRSIKLIEEGNSDEVTSELETILQFASRIPTGRDGQNRLASTPGFTEKISKLRIELRNYDKNYRELQELIANDKTDTELIGVVGSFPENQTPENINAWQDKKNEFLRENPTFEKDFNTITKAYGRSELDAANDLFVQTMTGELGGTKRAMALEWNKWFNGTPQTEPFAKILKEGLRAVDDFYQGSSRDIDDYISEGQKLINGYIKRDKNTGAYIDGTDGVRVDVNYWWRNKIIDLYRKKRKELGRRPERDDIEQEFRKLIPDIAPYVKKQLEESNLNSYINVGLKDSKDETPKPVDGIEFGSQNLDVGEKIDVKQDSLMEAITKINNTKTKKNESKVLTNIPKTPREQFLNDQKGIDFGFASEVTQDDIEKEKAREAKENQTTIKVRKGDTLYSLSQLYNTTVEKIKELNNKVTDRIDIDEDLIMPTITRLVNTVGDAVVPKEDLKNRSVLEEIDITKPFSYDSLYRLAMEVGFPPEDARIMAAIALAESKGDAQIDTVASGTDPNKENEFSLGLWQINVIKEYQEERFPLFNIKSPQELYNPLTNAKAAFILYDRRKREKRFDDWSTYLDGSYKKFLPKPK